MNVTYQSVSKWENEIANPDLSLIVPLAKLLGVSTDTLLCMDLCDEVKNKYISELKSISNWQKEERKKRLDIAKKLFDEFPKDADANYYYAFCLSDYVQYDADNSEKISLLKECEKSYRYFLDNLPQNNNGNAARLSLINILCKLGKKDEAVALSDKQGADKEHQIECYKRCLEGDEKEIKLLIYSSGKANEFLRSLYSIKTEEAFDIAMNFLRLLNPVPNDGYYDSLINLLALKADKYVNDGEYDKAMELYTECARLALLLEEYVKANPNEEPWYTSALYQKCLGDKEIYYDLNPHEMVNTFITSPANKPLFARQDHKELCKTLEKRIRDYDPFGEK